jgi:hypothetical protein
MGSLRDIAPSAALLGRTVRSLPELRPVSWMERLVVGRTRGEEIHLYRPQEWLRHEWEVRLGSLAGVIYKVGLEARMRDRADAEVTWLQLQESVSRELGRPQSVAPGMLPWDATDGNVVVQVASVAGESRVMVFLTSSNVRNLVR